jgi:hypothetical protein
MPSALLIGPDIIVQDSEECLGDIGSHRFVMLDGEHLMEKSAG